MPTNLYGPNDNYDLNTSHVLPALIRKFHTAKVNGADQVTLWGSGAPYREFLHVDDLADASLFLMDVYNELGTINVGYGEDISIGDLGRLIKEIVGFDGEMVFDTSKPDGTPRKLMDSSRINKLGWTPQIPLMKGIRQVYSDVEKSGW